MPKLLITGGSSKIVFPLVQKLRKKMSLKKIWNEQYDGKSLSALKDKNLFDLEINLINLIKK